MAQKKKEIRARSFAFLVYPESAPANWRSIIDSWHIPWAESPLHNMDVDPGTGLVKKEHWHILLCFDSLKSIDQIKELLAELGDGATIPIKLNSAKGMLRYFCHLDNPEKYQYPRELIVGHGGLDIDDILKPSASARYAYIKEMCQFVTDSCITEFYELIDYAMEEKMETWFPLLCDNSSYIVNQYIKSNRQRVYLSRKEE